MKEPFYNSEYFTEDQLIEIERWPYQKALDLIEKLRDMWCFNNYFIEKWVGETLHLELHTGGFSSNEDIIKALEQNKFFMFFFHEKWIRGGHYYFEIKPRSLNFRPVSEVAKLEGRSRQSIHQNSDKYEWITVGKRNKMIRLK